MRNTTPADPQHISLPTDTIMETDSLISTQSPSILTKTDVLENSASEKTVDQDLTLEDQAELDTFYVCSPLANEDLVQLWEIISDPYNPPSPGREERHQGVDFSYYRRDGRIGIEGETIQAILPGFVAAKIFDRLPYGNMVILETPADFLPDSLLEILLLDKTKSLYTLYAHMKEEPNVTLGEEINCGQSIGIVGSTGYNIVNPHLHLETRIGLEGASFESMAFYDTSATPLEMENYRRWRTSGDFTHFDPMILFQFFLEYKKEQ